MVSQNRIDVTY